MSSQYGFETEQERVLKRAQAQAIKDEQDRGDRIVADGIDREHGATIGDILQEFAQHADWANRRGSRSAPFASRTLGSSAR